MKKLKRTKTTSLPDRPDWDEPDFVPVADRLAEFLRVDAVELEDLVSLSLGLERDWADDEPAYRKWLHEAKVHFGSKGRNARIENDLFPKLILVRPRDGFRWMRAQLGSLVPDVEDFFRFESLPLMSAFSEAPAQKALTQPLVMAAPQNAREENALTTARVILGLSVYWQLSDSLKDGSYGAWTFLPAVDNEGFKMPEGTPEKSQYTRAKVQAHVVKALQTALGEEKFAAEFPMLLEMAAKLKT
jgi:hypothetical protein